MLYAIVRYLNVAINHRDGQRTSLYEVSERGEVAFTLLIEEKIPFFFSVFFFFFAPVSSFFFSRHENMLRVTQRPRSPIFRFFGELWSEFRFFSRFFRNKKKKAQDVVDWRRPKRVVFLAPPIYIPPVLLLHHSVMTLLSSFL